MLLILISALIGFWLGKIPGLLIGVVIAYLFQRAMLDAARQNLRGVEAQFVESTFAVMGALCKADGVVTRDEIRVTEELFVQLQLSPEQKTAAKAAFNRGKSPDFDLDAEVDDFVRGARGGGGLFLLFLQVQVAAVAADGQVHPAEHAMLVRVARRLGLSERDVAQLEALLQAASRGPATSGRVPTEQRLAAAYAALGVTPDSTVPDIKRAYRKLMNENHPDKIAGKGLPESMRKIAEERAREINSAYDLIKQARHFA